MPLPAFFGKPGRDRNRRSQRQEAAHARKTGGRVQPGSGSSWRAPQDVRGPLLDESGHMDQLKFTDKTTYVLNLHELMKIRKDALQAGREGRLFVEFAHGWGHNRPLTVKITIEEQ